MTKYFRGMVAFMLPMIHHAFLVRPQPKQTTRLYIEDWVADMIDHELWRQDHKKDFEREWMEQNRAVLLHQLSSSHDEDSMLTTTLAETSTTSVLSSIDPEDFRQYQKDKNLAKKDPQAYCADRCVATGNCDIFEDL